MKSLWPYLLRIDFPADVFLFFRVLVKIIHYRTIIKNQTFHRIVDNIINKPERQQKNTEKKKNREDEILKIWKICNIILIRVLHSSNSCLIRSLLLFEYIRHRCIKAVLILGIKKNISCLEGHCWIEIGGRPFRENEDLIKSYYKIITVTF